MFSDKLCGQCADEEAPPAFAPILVSIWHTHKTHKTQNTKHKTQNSKHKTQNTKHKNTHRTIPRHNAPVQKRKIKERLKSMASEKIYRVSRASLTQLENVSFAKLEKFFSCLISTILQECHIVKTKWMPNAFIAMNGEKTKKQRTYSWTSRG